MISRLGGIWRNKGEQAAPETTYVKKSSGNGVPKKDTVEPDVNPFRIETHPQFKIRHGEISLSKEFDDVRFRKIWSRQEFLEL